MGIKILYIVIYVIEAAIAWQYFGRMFPSKYKEWKNAGWIGAGYFVLFLCSNLEAVWLNIISFMIVNMVLLIKRYDIPWMNASFLSFIMTVAMSSLEICTGSLLGLFSSRFYIGEKYLMSMIWLAIISKLFYFCLLLLLVKIFGTYKRRHIHHDYGYILLIAVPFCSLCIMLVLFSVGMATELSSLLESLVAFSALLLLVINITIYAIYNSSQKRSAELRTTQLQLQKEHDEADYYKKLLQQDEYQKILIHDIRRHIQSIDILLSQNDISQAREYIKQLYDMPEFKNIVKFSDNDLLNLILNRYLEICNQKQVKLNVEIRKDSMKFVNADDITALFCNLLDNAIEAVSKVEDGYIDLRVWYKEKQEATLITLVNPCRKKPDTDGKPFHRAVRSENPYHGYGMKIIARAAERYHGELQSYYNETDSTFHVTVMLRKQ